MNIVYTLPTGWYLSNELPPVFDNSPFCEAISIDKETVRFWSKAVVVDMPAFYFMPLIAKLRCFELPFPELTVKAFYGVYENFKEYKLTDSPFYVNNLQDKNSVSMYHAHPNISVSFDMDPDEGYFIAFTYGMLEGLWRLYADVQNALREKRC